MFDSSILRIGLVQYANALPLEAYLSQTLPVARLIRDVPSALGRMLSRNELDVAMLSTIELLRHPEYSYIPGIGICSDGPVRSVCLFTPKEITQLQTIALDVSSLTSIMLIRIFCAEYWHIQPRFLDYAPPVEKGLEIADAALSIGDATLNSRSLPVRKIDLGEVWKEFTGLPFVYAVWITRPGLNPESLIPSFAEAKSLGLANLDAISQQCAENIHLGVDFFQTYFSENLHYDLRERELQGMKLFLEKSKKYE